MKLLVTLLLTFLSFFVSAQTTTVTMTGIGDIKLGMETSRPGKVIKPGLKIAPCKF